MFIYPNQQYASRQISFIDFYIGLMRCVIYRFVERQQPLKYCTLQPQWEYMCQCQLVSHKSSILNRYQYSYLYEVCQKNNETRLSKITLRNYQQINDISFKIWLNQSWKCSTVGSFHPFYTVFLIFFPLHSQNVHSASNDRWK